MSVHVLTRNDPNGSDQCPGFITALVLRVAQRDEVALGALFDLALPLVLATMGRRVTTPTAMDDQVVEAFVRIWCYAHTYDPQAQGVAAWMVEQVLATVEPPVEAHVG